MNIIDYHWEELWKAVISLLEFVSSKFESVKMLGRVDELLEEV